MKYLKTHEGFSEDLEKLEKEKENILKRLKDIEKEKSTLISNKKEEDRKSEVQKAKKDFDFDNFDYKNKKDLEKLGEIIAKEWDLKNPEIRTGDWSLGDGLSKIQLMVKGGYYTFRIVFSEDGKYLVSKPKERQYFGMLPDGGTYVQYGTSGMNNPAPSSNVTGKSKEIKSLKDILDFIQYCNDVVRRIHSAYAKSFAEWVTATGGHHGNPVWMD